MTIQSETQSGKKKRWEFLYEHDRIKRERLTQMKEQVTQMKQKKEKEECTFQPTLITKKSTDESMRPHDEELVRKSITSLFERNMRWKNAKDEKIKSQQDDKAEMERLNITFKPQIKKYDKEKETKRQENS
mmetsp:Transcript_11737/g.11661  ORF Transcript_11737/g.11661 Transcript_11737/m.11661 type:complete len:131 (-) Transcript_11737:476-868(-)|eukprot:CAMPEP_0170560642 /NCGR_PEP_ID=MMETSP0211-20121228/50059_1 /TAXON_ID=311385 /ORGANISM="Pseudokeronopsis sp., Strain OXSARD2" /LENGTH=130 /DNA_ID=CAMNT_0010875085 /DNA_START=435 /DNA_END=827 /DNA_ORIENTATION=-